MALSLRKVWIIIKLLILYEQFPFTSRQSGQSLVASFIRFKNYCFHFQVAGIGKLLIGFKTLGLTSFQLPITVNINYGNTPADTGPCSE